MENGSHFDTHCSTVSEVNQMVREHLEGHFPPLWVQGEISNFISHSSGHWYFTLKDANSQIKMVMFRRANQVLHFQPKSGQEVKILGSIGVYKPRGEYQIVCEKMKLAGLGALQEEFEKLKLKLKKEGLFERKRLLPYLPRHIIVISSPTGAAIRDVLNILKRRHKGVQVTLVPALVQGEKAPQSLLSALELAKTVKTADVLILTRGGGSLEDLSAFNNEALARALFKFPLPVISAVGHEIDFTITDFIADLRAPTPSAAAELVVKNSAELSDKVSSLKKRLFQEILRQVAHLKDSLENNRPLLFSPEKKIKDFQQYVDDLSTRLSQGLIQKNKLCRQKLAGLVDVLDSLSPLKVLNRGYVLVKQKDTVVKTALDLKIGSEVDLRFSESEALAKILKIKTLKRKEV